MESNTDNDGSHVDSLKLALDHSWSWFSLHAGQRMQLVNYFVVAAAFITAAYATSLTANQHTVAGVIAVGGAVVSLAFGRLDARTRELVHAAEPALRQLEERLSVETGVAGLDFVARVANPMNKWSSYRFVIRSLTSTALLLFFTGAVYAFVQG